MTRKDYIRIARAIYNTKNSYGKNWDPNLFRALKDVSKAIAYELELDNPRFDRERFLTACGVNNND